MRPSRGEKWKQPRLRARVGVDAQRVGVLPRDVQAAGHAHDGARAVGLALVARALVGGRIPGVDERQRGG